jgi:acyl carrier protein
MKSNEFIDALCGALGRPAGTLTMSDSRETIEEWDSIGHLAMISVIHESFEISEDVANLRSFQTIGELVEGLKSLQLLQD